MSLKNKQTYFHLEPACDYKFFFILAEIISPLLAALKLGPHFRAQVNTLAFAITSRRWEENDKSSNHKETGEYVLHDCS